MLIMELGQMSHILISVNGLPTTVLMLPAPLMVSVYGITPIYRRCEGWQKGVARWAGWRAAKGGRVILRHKSDFVLGLTSRHCLSVSKPV